MRQKTVETFVERCNECLNKKMTRNAYLIHKGYTSNYFWSTWNSIHKAFEEDKLDVKYFNQAAEAIAALDGAYAIYTKEGVKCNEGKEDYTNIDRDEEGKIISYSFKITKKGKATLVGKLSRDDMDTICRLYTYFGQNLTKREVSRYFPEWSLVDFKRILNAWNITKDNCPLPPHRIEESTIEELESIQARNKEIDIQRKFEQNQIKFTEKQLKKIQLENYELKNKNAATKVILQELLGKDYFGGYPINQPEEFKETLIIFLSDLHIGAYNTTGGYINLPVYDESEINRRLTNLISYISTKAFDRLIVCDLGDNVDSYDKQTTRGGHELPTIMSNKEQSDLYLKVMMKFFNTLTSFTSDIVFYAVGESNHPGDWGWINSCLLASKLEHELNISSYISDKAIDCFDVNDVSIVYLHGKDNKTQFKGFPLNLNDKTVNWFNDYFITSGYPYKSKKIVVKGDLHQYSINEGHTFTYINAPSIYGSSQWICSNFGKGEAGILVMSIDSNNYVTTINVNIE